MSLCERPTRWLPQNPLSFIINYLLLIIQALLHTMHVLYRKGGRGRRKRQQQAGRKTEDESEKGKRLKRRRGTRKRGRKNRRISGEREERMRPVTCGIHPHPVRLHFISITSRTSSPPSHLLIKVLQLLGTWENREREKERPRDRGGGCKDRPMTVRENVIEMKGNNTSEAYLSLFPHVSGSQISPIHC